MSLHSSSGMSSVIAFPFCFLTHSSCALNLSPKFGFFFFRWSSIFFMFSDCGLMIACCCQ